MRLLVPAAVLLCTAVPALAGDSALERMMRGESAMQGKKLEKAIAKAEQHPLGSRENPVRVTMPVGQRAYLSRQRCSDGKAPEFQRAGNVGPGPYDNIVDLYIVVCKDGEPKRSEVFMDMYHSPHAEQRPLPGFAGPEPIAEPIPVPVPLPEPVKEPTA